MTCSQSNDIPVMFFRLQKIERADSLPKRPVGPRWRGTILCETFTPQGLVENVDLALKNDVLIY
ncbi:hypothetical protein [Pacificibacter maritimus]|uniref:hypothetical protein n=1 Tax=Pacificibacter maritimus TaxID=762213 RepID=UPI0014730131|nr:hypothetical protein [Pacificibacter maritimus]